MDHMNTLTLRLIGLLVPLGCLCTSLIAAAPASPARPNILFILADDLGYVDFNAYAARLTGAKTSEMYYETPNLDRLSREGTSFAQAYAAQLCAPTRAGLLTGKIAPRIGVTTATPHTVRTFYNQGLTPPPGYLATDALYWGDPIKIEQALLNGSTLEMLPSGQPLDEGRDETTIAEALTDYRSAFIGKWHVGGHGSRGWQPHDQGFESLAYSDEGGSAYFNWRGAWDNRRLRYPRMPQPELLAGKAGPDTGHDYLTDSLTEIAVRFVREQAAQESAPPFFLYLCHFAVHTPFQAKAEDIAYFENKATRGWNGHANAVYAAMLKSLDDSVGRLLDVLTETGLAENTLVVFMSDNGGVTYTNPTATSNAPLKGGKAMMFEGGLRVPLVFRQPGTVAADQWSDVPVDYADLFPTLLQHAGYDPEPHHARIDGRSLVPVLNDPTNARDGYPRDTFYWHYPFNVGIAHPDDGLPPAPHSAIREGDWKLIFDWSGKLYLHDMSTDWREEHNLADSNPAKARELFKKLNGWLDANVEVKYTPLLNPDYDPSRESRSRSFVDLRKQILGESYSIRTAGSDPRIEMLNEQNRLNPPPPVPTGPKQ